MKKIFISMPMNGKTDEQTKKDFEENKKYLKKHWGFNPELVIDSIIGDGTDNPVKYLAKSIDLIADADIVFFASGWERARGCKIEHEVAVAYGKVVLYEQ